MYKQARSFTLLELLFAISLLTLIVIGFANIHSFSQAHLINSDRRSKMQHEISFILEHLTKQLKGQETQGLAKGGAIGSKLELPIELTKIGNDDAILIRIDSNPNGRRDSADTRIAYRYAATGHSIRFCPNYTGSANDVYESLSERITALDPIYDALNNYLEVKLNGRWDTARNPSLDNPEVTMSTRINLPSVSTN